MTNSLPLYDRFEAQAAGLIARIKAQMNRCLDESGFSREQVLDRMNALADAAGVKLTAGNSKSLGLATLEKWLNPAEREHIPGILSINVFSAALGDPRPLSVQLAAHGCEVMTDDDRFWRDYGRAVQAEKKARRERRRLEMEATS